MAAESPPAAVAGGGRVFATHPAAVVVPIVSAEEQLLLLEHPRRRGWWEPVNGGRLLPPLDQAWLRLRTLELFRLWQPAQDVPLQGPLTEPGWNKADHLS